MTTLIHNKTDCNDLFVSDISVMSVNGIHAIDLYHRMPNINKDSLKSMHSTTTTAQPFTIKNRLQHGNWAFVDRHDKIYAPPHNAVDRTNQHRHPHQSIHNSTNGSSITTSIQCLGRLFSTNYSLSMTFCSKWIKRIYIELDSSKAPSRQIRKSNANFILFRFLLFVRCGVEVKLWRAILDHRKQFTNLRRVSADVNSNELSRRPVISVSESTTPPPPPSPSYAEKQFAHRNSHCETGATHTNNSSDDYESCNGTD